MKSKQLFFGGKKPARRVVVEDVSGDGVGFGRDDVSSSLSDSDGSAPVVPLLNQLSSSHSLNTSRWSDSAGRGELPTARTESSSLAESLVGHDDGASVHLKTDIPSHPERLVVPLTVDRRDTYRGPRKGEARGRLSGRASTSSDLVPLPTDVRALPVLPPPVSPAPRGALCGQRNSRLSLSSSIAHECGGTDMSGAFLQAWLNSVLDPWGVASTAADRRLSADSRSFVAIYAHRDILRDRIFRQWEDMGVSAHSSFHDPMCKVATRLARNPLKVAKAMESVLKTPAIKDRVMEALGSYARVWFDVASDIVDFALSENGIQPLSEREHSWLEGMVSRHARKSRRSQAFAKLSPESYCRISLQIIAVALFLDGVFTSTAWMIPMWAPPLFVGRIRSTEGILQDTAGIFLDQNNICRYLKRSDYSVAYNQAPEQCPSFAVSNMAVDLRDGVALCRLTELLVPDCGRLKPLYPALKTSQRICNIDLALQKLGMFDPGLSRRIADGDESATTGLLWNCIVKYELDKSLNLNVISSELKRMNMNADQGMVESLLEDVAVRDHFLHALIKDKSNAASLVLHWACCLSNSMQSKAEGRDNSYEVSEFMSREKMNDHPLGSAKGRRHVLESFLLRYGGLSVHSHRERMAGSLTNKVEYMLKSLGCELGVPWIFPEDELLHSEKLLDQRRLVVLYALLLKRVLSVNHEQRAAVIIQNHWRMYCRKKMMPEHARQNLRKWVNAATVIQRNVRPYLARIRIERSRESRAAFIGHIVRAQAIWRQKCSTNSYKLTRDAAIVIQSHWRGHAGRAWVQALLEEKERHSTAALVIQTNWRTYSSRIEFKSVVEASSLVQRVWRMRVCRDEFVNQRQAAIVLQKYTRRLLVNLDMKDRKTASIVIQRTWRTKQCRDAFLAKSCAAVTIQSMWRMVMDQETAARRLHSVLKIQRCWRETHRKRLVEISDGLQRATLDLTAALAEFSTMTRARIRLESGVAREENAACSIQNAWRNYRLTRKMSSYLMDVYARARAAVRVKEQAAQEAEAARLIQNAWRSYSLVRKVSSFLMKSYTNAKETARLNQMYGPAVLIIQSQYRGHVVRSHHTYSTALAAIRQRLRSATRRADILRSTGTSDPSTLGNMTRIALEGFQCGSNLPSPSILQGLKRCLGGSCACCNQFMDGNGVEYLLNSVLSVSTDRMMEDSIELALGCMEALVACGRFTDRAGIIMLGLSDGNILKRLLSLLYELKENSELFDAIVRVLSALGKGHQFRQTVSSSLELSGPLINAQRAISLKQSQVYMYLTALEGGKGSELSIANAKRTLFRMEQQTSALGRLLALLGVEDVSMKGPREIETSSIDQTAIYAASRVSLKKSNGTGTLPTSPAKLGPPRKVLGALSMNTSGTALNTRHI
jgi:hypothetical protein